MLSPAWSDNRMMRVLILQHTPSNPAGIYRELVEERGCVPTVVELDQGDPIPDWTAYDAIITMGGHMGVNDGQAFPWLRDEMTVIGEAVRSGMPYWGVCLGGQLLAASLGARVNRLPQSEVGFPLIELAPSAAGDPVFSRLRRPLHAFVWHEDAFDLPPGAVHLGGTAQANQAFRWREQAYGVQFHLEATAEMVSEWLEIPGSRASLERQLGPGGPERVLRELERRKAEQEAAARVLAGAWLDGFSGEPGMKPGSKLSSARPD
jgi:GMP synthase (glutamine-hydrolysing)